MSIVLKSKYDDELNSLFSLSRTSVSETTYFAIITRSKRPLIKNWVF